MVCGAGNGPWTNQNIPPWWFYFPASYDHNISVSNVGYEGDISNETFNVKHVHEINISDTDSCFQHNSRVDLCAPAVRIGGHYYHPNEPNEHYGHASGWGTSFASPQVAGTVALMLTRMPWLTPYQIEYILKKSSYDFRHLVPNQKYAGTTRYTGRIGAGTLDAGAALDSIDVDSFIADYPTTATFRIKGVKLNTKCPPQAPNVPNPRLEVVMENGTPPYTYKWEPYPDNNAYVFPQYDSAGIDSIVATVDSLPHPFDPPVFHYRLTVYDNSEIQKVASKDVFFEMDINMPHQLVMQDAYADLFDEPNRMKERSALDWDIWSSPDIWNRRAQDGDTAHENPVYHTTNPNYMYVRVRNIGCVASPNNNPDSASLWLYWTVASTGEKWPNDWNGSTTLNNLAAGGIITPNGISIPSILPGKDTILSHSWFPPKPQDYDSLSGILDRIDVCGLARIQTAFTSPYGMTFPEVAATKENVLNNNKVVTRNFVLINLSTTPTPSTYKTVVVVGNTKNTPKTYTIQMATENQLQPYIAGHLGSYMVVTIQMRDLYDLWDAGGKMGNPTGYNDDLKTIDWNMEQPLRLENISFDPGEQMYIILEFKGKGGVSVPYDITNQMIYFRQIASEVVDIGNGDGTTFQVTRDNVSSSVGYAVNIQSSTGGGNKPGKPTKIGTFIQEKESSFDIYPNPTNKQLTLSINSGATSTYRITVTDISGKLVFEDVQALFSNRLYHINTSRFVPGMYYVQLADKGGNVSVRKFVKMD